MRAAMKDAHSLGALVAFFQVAIALSTKTAAAARFP
jgi:hypothetical protein